MNICRKARPRGLGTTSASPSSRPDSFTQHLCGLRCSRLSTTIAVKQDGDDLPPKAKPSAKERFADREFLLNFLKGSPIKRDAKSYIQHYSLSQKSNPAVIPKIELAVSELVGQANYNNWRLSKTGVNLGNLYPPTKAIEESPVFTQQPLPDQFVPENAETVHIALVKLRQPQILDEDTLQGIALTLSQLVRLGLNIALVVDCDEAEVPEVPEEFTQSWERYVFKQADRIVAALNEHNTPGAVRIENAFGYSEIKNEIPTTVYVRGGVEVKNKNLLLPLLEAGIIPVIPPIAHTTDLQTKMRVPPDDLILALTREFAGITAQKIQEDSLEKMVEIPIEKAESVQEKPILDRIIILDPLGGIPSDERPDKAHVFINLEQEYKYVRKELLQYSTPTLPKQEDKYSILGNSNPFSKIMEQDIKPLNPSIRNQIAPKPKPSRHIKNLDTVQRTLKLLPPSSSALIITPLSAAISSQPPSPASPTTSVRTRRQKNPLIHNLLTDKPMISSSLPHSRLHAPETDTTPNRPTFLKKGIPVTIIPDPRTHPWVPPSAAAPSIELQNDPRIDVPRLLDLIEDSFQRKLDAPHYLSRIRGRVAGVIIAGEYEGGAICTWEEPPDSSPSSPSAPVPYLDKFAVRTRSQGSGGVADVVFNALVRTCFPNGVVWRSRSNNPVNKWYFERAAGMWKLPGDQWTMFWTTEGVVEEFGERVRRGEAGGGRWDAYVGVCKGVAPSWADGKRPD
ncbi:N-acetylglutamate synthase [Cenococcum geophilum]